MPSTPRSNLFLVLMLAAAPAVMCFLPAAGAFAGEQPADSGFDRPDAETVRTEVQSILDDPRYAPRKSFIQWLLEKLRGRGRRSGISWFGGPGDVLFWVVTVWCTLALLTLLGHAVWTVVVMVRARRRSSDPDALSAGSARDRPKSYKDLNKQMRELAGRGAYREAIGVMMVALLHRLESADLLRFHQSKTNGDYVREYPPQHPGEEDFRTFALDFDAAVYGGALCDRRVYEHMNNTFEQMVSDVRKKQ